MFYIKLHIKTVAGATYVGQARQYISKRIQTHKYSSTDKTAPSDHKLRTKHTFDFENTIILNRERHQKR